MRLVVIASLVLLAAQPVLAQPSVAPAPGEVPAAPGFWRQWEADAKTAAAARALGAPPVKMSPAQEL